jgi:nucleoside-triphosphatase
MQERKTNKFLLTGVPGSGKTTVIIRLAKLLHERKIGGFFTREIRQAGQRTGFSLETFSGRKSILSSIHFKTGPKVGKYRVDLESFENFLEEVKKNIQQAEICLIDEIGKMECSSLKFIKMIEQVSESNIPFVATVALKGSGLIADIKKHRDIELIHIIPGTRHLLPAMIAAQLGS